MPALIAELKQLIARLAKKEVKIALAKSRKLRGENQSLRSRVKSLEANTARLVKAIKKSGATVSIPTTGDETTLKRLRFTAKGIKALRRKTRLSQADFGKLVGASTLTISNWELGKALPRKSSDAFRKLIEIRNAKMGVREAKRLLETASTLATDEKAEAPATRKSKRKAKKTTQAKGTKKSRKAKKPAKSKASQKPEKKRKSTRKGSGPRKATKAQRPIQTTDVSTPSTAYEAKETK